MTDPSADDTKVNWLAILALVIGAVTILFNPYLLLSVIAIALGIVALISARAQAVSETMLNDQASSAG